MMLTLLSIELHAADEFYKHTAKSFKKRIRDIEKTYEKYSDEQLDQDLGGTTMGELAGEQIQETGMLSEMNGYFGILTVYASLERFLLWVFKDMQRRGEVTGEAAKKTFLPLDDYKDVLKNDLGIYLSKPPFEWSEIIKLQALRNVIAHHNGYVIEDQLKRVAPYRYKVGMSIVISEEYFDHAIDVVRKTCLTLSQNLDALPTQKKPKK